MLMITTRQGKVKGVPMKNSVTVYTRSGVAKNIILNGGSGGVVTSFNTRVGDIELTSEDVTNALGFAPASFITLIEASTNVPAFAPILSTGIVADSNNITHRHKVVGISISAAMATFNISVQFGGMVINPAWAWTAGQKIYINGSSLNNVAPSTGWSMSVGKALSATKILVNLQQSFLL